MVLPAARVLPPGKNIIYPRHIIVISPAQDREEIEGLDPALPDEPFRDYPIDSLHIRHETRTIFEVVRRINQGSYVMDPDFQRDFIWDEQRQSRLIESVLMRIPLPVFYLAENQEGELVVVDGLQRLSTFQRFVSDQLALSLLNRELDGKTFGDLSPKLKNRIEDAQLILYIIDYKVSEQAKLDIFERVNSGVPLTRQQMRNCLYMGQATRWLRKEANTELFIEATGNSLDASSMRDREVVNRFCSFALLGYGEHKGNLDEFLAEGLKRMNQLESNELDALRDKFHRALKNNLAVFAKHAFRKHSRDQNARKPFNVALFDTFSTLLADRPEDDVAARADTLRSSFYSLMEDADFVTSISNSTSSPARVKTRFDKVCEMLAGVFDADSD
ncbi:MAG: DUF262 domain-containing protein [Proteobacteria bacterium]|nr:DUF262 domain-containing protein [Pseudomonadota bacterium]